MEKTREKSFNKDTMTFISKNMFGVISNSVSKGASNINSTRELLLPSSIKHEKMENFSTFEPYPVKATRKHDLQQAENITVKVEPDWDHSKVQRFSEDILMHKWDKLEPTVIQSERKIIQNREYTWDLPNKISNCDLNESLEFSPRQLEMSLKTESSEFKSEVDKWPKIPEIVYDDWKIKNEEVDPKEEDLTEKENKCREFSSYKPLLTSLKTETKSEIEKWPNAYDDWTTKDEEVDLKEEDMLEINSQSQSMSPGRCRQEKYDPYKKFKCHVCDYQTERKSNLNAHLMKHKKLEEITSFKCDKCDFVTRYKGALKKHALRHKNLEEVDLLRCDKCEYMTRYKGALKKHSLRHKNPEEVDSFKCDKCEYVTRYKGALKKHALRHKNADEVDFFVCDTCEYQSRFKDDLKKHQLKHKNLDEAISFKCNKCEFRTLYRCALKRHILRHKNLEEVDLFRCSKCEYQSCFKSELKKHVLRHNNPKKSKKI